MKPVGLGAKRVRTEVVISGYSKTGAGAGQTSPVRRGSEAGPDGTKAAARGHEGIKARAELYLSRTARPPSSEWPGEGPGKRPCNVSLRAAASAPLCFMMCARWGADPSARWNRFVCGRVDFVPGAVFGVVPGLSLTLA